MKHSLVRAPATNECQVTHFVDYARSSYNDTAEWFLGGFEDVGNVEVVWSVEPRRLFVFGCSFLGPSGAKFHSRDLERVSKDMLDNRG